MGHGHGLMSSWTMSDKRKNAQSSTAIAPTSALSPWGWTRRWTPACHSPRRHPCHLPWTGRRKLAANLAQPAKSSHSCSQSLKGPPWQLSLLEMAASALKRDNNGPESLPHTALGWISTQITIQHLRDLQFASGWPSWGLLCDSVILD